MTGSSIIPAITTHHMETEQKRIMLKLKTDGIEDDSLAASQWANIKSTMIILSTPLVPICDVYGLKEKWN